MTPYEEIEFILEEIEGMTQRHPLEVGFNHSPVTIRELSQRLQNIREYCQAIKPTVKRILGD